MAAVGALDKWLDHSYRTTYWMLRHSQNGPYIAELFGKYDDCDIRCGGASFDKSEAIEWAIARWPEAVDRARQEWLVKHTSGEIAS
jgi:hypothetical protein